MQDRCFRHFDQVHSRHATQAILHNQPSIYRARPVFAALVQQSLVRCGGEVADQSAAPLYLIDRGRP